MCQLFDEIREEGEAVGWAKGKAEGIEEGKAKGVEEGKFKNLKDNVERLMEQLHMSVQQVFDLLGVSEADRAVVMSML